MTTDTDFEARLLRCRSRLRRVAGELEALPCWSEAEPLIDALEQTRRRINELALERERKLAVVIVGPCGAGKSTLLNALAGQDDLSRAGASRPTTHDLTVFCARPEDGRYFKEKAGVENVRVVASRAARDLHNLVLVDTPDTNSTEGERHRPVVEAAIEAADILLCVFPADRATVRDQIEYLKPRVELNPAGVHIVVTRSEALSREALEKDVIAPLEALLAEVWPPITRRTFALSARSHLTHPGWKPREEPVDGARDDFPALRAEIHETLNRPGYAVDLRAARAEEWTELALTQVARAAAASADSARRAATGIRELSVELWRVGARRMTDGFAASGLEVRIARRLWGPLSWCLLAWAFAVQTVEALTAFAGMLRRVFGGRDKTGYAETPETKPGVGASWTGEAIRAADMAWPDIADHLRNAGIMPKARANPLDVESGETFLGRLEGRLRAKRDNQASRIANATFSGVLPVLLLNLLFLAPVAGLLAAGVGQLANREPLGPGFGREGLYFIGFWWLLMQALMHGWVCAKERRMGGRERAEGLPDPSNPIIVAPELLVALETIPMFQRVNEATNASDGYLDSPTIIPSQENHKDRPLSIGVNIQN